MRRFWVEAGQINGGLVEFSPDQAHHIRDVCRFGLGDEIHVLAGPEHSYRAKISESNRLQMRAQIIDKISVQALSGPAIHVCLSVPKFPKVDWVVEKIVELGATSLRLFVSEHSYVRKTQDVPRSKTERWQKLAVSALQQSGRVEPLQMPQVATLSDCLKAINRSAGQVGLFCCEPSNAPSAQEQSLHAAIQALKQQKPSELFLFIGSEGGFSAGEIAMFQSAQLFPTVFGSQILRVETACVALLSILKYELTHD